jgi:hypothetical protein
MMSVHRREDRKGWVVRWRDADGKQRSQSFKSEAEAKDFDRERRQQERRVSEQEMVEKALEQSLELSAAELRARVRQTRAFANGDWDVVSDSDARTSRVMNRVADMLERRAERMEKGEPVRTTPRPVRVAPTGVVAHEEGEGRPSFVVAEMTDPEIESSQRPVHDGVFLDVRAAAQYVALQPDKDTLSIVVLHSLYPIRDLTPAEIEAGELDDAADGMWSDLVREIYENADGTRR